MKHTELYPQHAQEKLELSKIIKQINDKCISTLGARYVDKMSVSSDFEFVKKALSQVSEFKYLIEHEDAFPIDFVADLEEDLNYLEINNSVLSEEQFLAMMLFLRTVKEMFQYFVKKQGRFPYLEAVLKADGFKQALLKSISDIIDDEGQVKNGVSPELDKIRKGLKSKERELDRKFQNIMMQAQENGWLASGGESIKNGRRVLALNAESKRRIKGIIHDESATGKSVFLEPEQTIELSNELFELRQEERREIYRILKQLSDDIRPEAQEVRFYQRMAGLFDFIRAKALYASSIKASLPELTNEPIIQLLQAYHPILWLRNKELDRKTMPLNLKLDSEKHILVISGPNAGGKSVALKTVGLLQVMLQIGLLVPASPDSRMGIFDKIFVELGDEQSIENDLSTYSSHLSHMKHFAEGADPATLFLIDEFGTGTDPKFGGAIAEAILEELNIRKAYGVVTTHYSNIKVFASHTAGILNGCMLFDVESLNPLYVLKLGQPGSSYAFEIARKTGLPQQIIESSLQKIDKDYQNFDSLLATLETDKHWLEMQRKRLEEERLETETIKESYTRLKEDLDKNKQKINLESKQKALQGLEETNRQFENLLRELNEKDKRKATEEKFRKELNVKKESLKKEIKEIKEEAAPPVPKGPAKEVKVGAQVKVGDGQQTGYVEEIRKDKALVAFANLKTLVPIADLEVISLPGEKVIKRMRNINYEEVTRDFSPSIDVRGKRTEEALREVESQLDKALLLNFHSLRILHGKGDGILRKMIRNMLAKYDFVKAYHSESPDFGGEGVTLVELQ